MEIYLGDIREENRNKGRGGEMWRSDIVNGEGKEGDRKWEGKERQEKRGRERELGRVRGWERVGEEYEKGKCDITQQNTDI